MTQRDPLSADASPPNDVAAQLRVVLRLAFAGSVADELAGRVRDEDDRAGLRRLLRSARSRLVLDHMLRRLPWWRDRGQSTAIGASSAVRPDDAVMLIARVGLGLDVLDISQLLDTTPEQVAASLFAGRRALDRRIGEACDRFAEAIGEYDDPSADPDERVALVTHARFCRSCNQAIERSRQVDTLIHSEMDRISVGLGSIPPARDRATRLRPELLLPAGLVAVAALVVVVGVVVFDHLTAPSHIPVSALAAPLPGPPLTGWLVTSGSLGQIQARNLRTGETRNVVPSDNENKRWPLISPDGSRLALVRQTPSAPFSGAFHVDVYDLDGLLLGTHEWGGDDAYRWPFGWLDSTTLLMSEWPLRATDETIEAYRSRLTRETVLLAVDAASGATRELLRGDIGYAVAAPDGAMVAVIGGSNASDGRLTVTVRPVSADGLGQPVWSYDTNDPGLVWSPDSGTIYASVFTGTPDSGQFPAIVAIDRSGSVTTLVRMGELGAVATPVTVTRDGQTVIVAAGDGSLTGVTYWKVDRTSGESQLLDGAESDGWPMMPLWSPDGGHLLLPIHEPFYLSSGNAGTSYPGGDSSVALVSYDASWQRRVVGGWLDSTRSLLAWLPEERFATTEPSRTGDAPTITAPEPVRLVRRSLQTSPDSATSPDGRFVILYDSDAKIPIIWDRTRQDGRQVAGDSTELTWLPGGRAILGVVPFADVANRLAGFAATAEDIIFTIDFQHFDPVGLAENTRAWYERPLASPNGAMMSFFVVDEARGDVTLWIAGWGQGSRAVARWSTPPDAIPSVPLTAVWLDDHTLLFARPDDWGRGMPRQATVVRVVVDGEDAQVDQLTGLGGRGGDRGVVVREMAVSPDGSQLVYRLRHYRAFAADRELRDSVSVVALTDLTRPIEIAGGGIGAGLSWSSDSRWIATGADGRILIASGDGRVIRDVASELPGAAHPVWVGNEVWFTAPDADSALWRVVVRN